MTLQRRIDKARNRLAALLSYASCSLGTDLHDSETWPTERHDNSCGTQADPADGFGYCTPNCRLYGQDEPITTEYDLWYITRKAPKE